MCTDTAKVTGKVSLAADLYYHLYVHQQFQCENNNPFTIPQTFWLHAESLFECIFYDSGPQLSHLFPSQGHHIQQTVHEATNQGLMPVLSCDDIIDSVVGGDILQTEKDVRLPLLFYHFLATRESVMTNKAKDK